MRINTAAGRVIAALLGILLASCSANRHVVSASDKAPTHRLLVIRELPDGTVVHSWQQAEEIGLPRRNFPTTPRNESPRIVRTMRHPRDCDEENRECVRECMSRPLPRGFGHITSRGRGKGGKLAYCHERCRQAYLDCSELQELQPQEFTAVDGVVDWVKRHRRALLLGSVVIIAGVAFVVVSAGAGLVVLAPAVLLSAPASASTPYMAEMSP